MRRLLTSTLIGVGGILVAALVGLVRVKVLALALHPADFGIYGQLVTFGFYAGTLGNLSIGLGLTTLIAGARGRGDDEAVSEIITSAIAISASASAVLTAAAIGASSLISPVLLGRHAALLVVLTSLSIPFIALQGPLQHVIQGYEDTMGQNVAFTLYSVAFTTLSAIGAFTLGIHGALLALLGGNVALLAAYGWRARRLQRSGGRWLRPSLAAVRGDVARRLLRLGGASLLVLVISYTGDLAIRVVLVHARGDATAGIWYGLSVISLQLFVPLVSALNYLVAPLVTRLAEANDRAGVHRVLDDSIRIVLLVIVPVGAAVTALRAPFVTIAFSSQFDAMRRVVPIQMVGEFLRALDWTLGFTLIPLGFTRAWVAIGGGSSIVYGFVGAYLADRIGVTGAAAAWAGMWALEFAAISMFFRRRNIWSPSPRTAAGCAIGGAAFVCAVLLPGATGFSAVCVVSTLAVFVLFRKDERRSGIAWFRLRLTRRRVRAT